MKNYFINIPQHELKEMYREAEITLIKTGWISRDGILREHYDKWSENKEKPTYVLFLLDLYHALCKELLQ